MAKRSVSNIQAFVERTRGQAITIGLDVHKNKYAVALRAPDGDCHVFMGPSGANWLIELIRINKIQVSTIVYEAGPTGFSAARAFIGAGFSCQVIAPAQTPRPAVTGAKTDRLDCLKLAELASKDMLQPVAIPTQQEEGQRSLVRRRHDLSRRMRGVKLRIRSLLLFFGASEPPGLEHWGKQSIVALDSTELEADGLRTLRSLIRELRFMQGELSEVEREIAFMHNDGLHRDIIENLRTVPGVGPIVSATFRHEIFSPDRFSRGEEVAKYIGLAPTAHESGETKHRARIIPTGQKTLRSLLVEAAWRWQSADPWAREAYHKRLSRCGLPQKAIVSLARRLAIILWRICVEHRPYRQYAA